MGIYIWENNWRYQRSNYKPQFDKEQTIQYNGRKQGQTILHTLVYIQQKYEHYELPLRRVWFQMLRKG
jgi:hypothetical protein